MIEEIKGLFTQFQAKNDEMLAEIKKTGSASQELKNQVDALNERIDELETKGKRPVLGGESTVQADETKAAFLEWARKGIESAELKSLSAGTNSDGGYLIPQQLESQINELLVELSPVRSVANVMTISNGNSIDIPVEAGAFATGWAAETGARAETASGTFTLVNIPAAELFANPQATQRILDDSALLESYIVRKIGEQMAAAEATAFVTGNGTNKPTGLLTATISEKVSGSAAAITAAGLIDLFYDLPDAYAKSASFLMKRSTVGAIRKLVDSNGQYLWQPGLMAGQPATILGRPVVEAIDMPAVAADAYPVLFGDFKAGYTILDRKGISILRDPYTNKPFVGFYAVKRVGGKVVKAEALRKLKISV